MSSQSSRRSLRRARTRTAALRQVRLFIRTVRERTFALSPHYFAKHHALNCSRPRCFLCGNPRRVRGRKELTLQELRAEEAARYDLAVLH